MIITTLVIIVLIILLCYQYNIYYYHTYRSVNDTNYYELILCINAIIIYSSWLWYPLKHVHGPGFSNKKDGF